MRFLPKANPLYENIAAGKMVVPDVLKKLAAGGFTGYLQHSAPGFEFYGIYAKGKLICALSSEAGGDNTGFEAVALLFDKALQVGGEINVYRMTPDVAVCGHALAVGSRILDGDEVRQVDVKSVLARVKSQGIHGVVRFYTPGRSAMMLYKDGLPIGFYHDGEDSISASPEESRRIAALPGARIEVCSTRPLDELMQYDLLQMVNLDKLWEAAQGRNAAVRPQASPLVAARSESAVSQEKLLELVDDIAEVATAYLSKEGRSIVERRVRGFGGPSCLADPELLSQLLSQVESDASAVDSDARIDEMIDLMKSEIAARLAV